MTGKSSDEVSDEYLAGATASRASGYLKAIKDLAELATREEFTGNAATRRGRLRRATIRDAVDVLGALHEAYKARSEQIKRVIAQLKNMARAAKEADS